MCGGAYGRRKRSARRKLMMQRQRKQNGKNSNKNIASFSGGIDNEAFEDGM